MQVNKIQNNNPQFKGMITVQNLKSGKKVLEQKTAHEFDRDLSAVILKTLFEGSWENTGRKNINLKDLALYAEVLKQTLGFNLLKNCKKTEQIVIKHFGNGYSIKAGNDYKITHIREDKVIWG